MLELNFDLPRRSNRPVITTKHNGMDFTHLIDTGAQVPLFCHGITSFKDFAVRCGGYVVDDSITVCGLGKYPVQACTFTLDTFSLLDKFGNTLTYRNLTFTVLADTSYPFDTILPANIFGKVKYSFDYTLETPLFTVQSEKDTYYAGFRRNNGPSYVFLTD